MTAVRGAAGPEDPGYIEVVGLLDDRISEETARHIAAAFAQVMSLAAHVPLVRVRFAPLEARTAAEIGPIAWSPIIPGRDVPGLELTIDPDLAAHPDKFANRTERRVRWRMLASGSGDPWVDLFLHEILGHGTDRADLDLSQVTLAQERIDRHIGGAFDALTAAGEIDVPKRRWLGRLSDYSYSSPRIPFRLPKLDPAEALPESVVYVRGNPDSDWRTAEYALYRALFDLPVLDSAAIARFRELEAAGTSQPHLLGLRMLEFDGSAGYLAPTESEPSAAAGGPIRIHRAGGTRFTDDRLRDHAKQLLPEGTEPATVALTARMVGRMLATFDARTSLNVALWLTDTDSGPVVVVQADEIVASDQQRVVQRRVVKYGADVSVTGRGLRYLFQVPLSVIAATTSTSPVPRPGNPGIPGASGHNRVGWAPGSAVGGSGGDPGKIGRTPPNPDEPDAWSGWKRRSIPAEETRRRAAGPGGTKRAVPGVDAPPETSPIDGLVESGPPGGTVTLDRAPGTAVLVASESTEPGVTSTDTGATVSPGGADSRPDQPEYPGSARPDVDVERDRIAGVVDKTLPFLPEEDLDLTFAEPDDIEDLYYRGRHRGAYEGKHRRDSSPASGSGRFLNWTLGLLLERRTAAAAMPPPDDDGTASGRPIGPPVADERDPDVLDAGDPGVRTDRIPFDRTDPTHHQEPAAAASRQAIGQEVRDLATGPDLPRSDETPPDLAGGAQHADMLFVNAVLVDGTGRPPVRGGLAISNGRIVAVGDVSGFTAGETVDAGGKIVSPGFIDTHSHFDRALFGTMLPAVSQGITTVVVGNCGISSAPRSAAGRPPAPLDLVGTEQEHFFATVQSNISALTDMPPVANAAMLVGHTSLRLEVMGEDYERPATAAEIEEMRALLRAALEAGAIGLSTGVFYPPAAHATTEEIVALAEVLAEFDAVYTTHMRDDSGSDADLEETFEVLRRTGVRGLISHYKFTGAANHGKAEAGLAKIEAARKPRSEGGEGLRVWVDVYPYEAGSTMLHMDSVRESSRVLVAWSDSHPEMSGRLLTDIATEWNVPLEEAVDRLQPAGGVFFMMDKQDVAAIIRHPDSMIGSDGLPHDDHPHPRLFGSIPRVLGSGLLSFEEAVRRMTSLPAEFFGFADRGTLEAGNRADVVMFDPETVGDRATYEDPRKVSAGIGLVMVNGTVVWRDGNQSGVYPGEILSRGEGDDSTANTDRVEEETGYQGSLNRTAVQGNSAVDSPKAEAPSDDSDRPAIDATGGEGVIAREPTDEERRRGRLGDRPWQCAVGGAGFAAGRVGRVWAEDSAGSTQEVSKEQRERIAALADSLGGGASYTLAEALGNDWLRGYVTNLDDLVHVIVSDDTELPLIGPDCTVLVGADVADEDADPSDTNGHVLVLYRDGAGPVRVRETIGGQEFDYPYRRGMRVAGATKYYRMAWDGPVAAMPLAEGELSTAVAGADRPTSWSGMPLPGGDEPSTDSDPKTTARLPVSEDDDTRKLSDTEEIAATAALPREIDVIEQQIRGALEGIGRSGAPLASELVDRPLDRETTAAIRSELNDRLKHAAPDQHTDLKRLFQSLIDLIDWYHTATVDSAADAQRMANGKFLLGRVRVVTNEPGAVVAGSETDGQQRTAGTPPIADQAIESVADARRRSDALEQEPPHPDSAPWLIRLPKIEKLTPEVAVATTDGEITIMAKAGPQAVAQAISENENVRRRIEDHIRNQMEAIKAGAGSGPATGVRVYFGNVANSVNEGLILVQGNRVLVQDGGGQWFERKGEIPKAEGDHAAGEIRRGLWADSRSAFGSTAEETRQGDPAGPRGATAREEASGPDGTAGYRGPLGLPKGFLPSPEQLDDEINKRAQSTGGPVPSDESDGASFAEWQEGDGTTQNVAVERQVRGPRPAPGIEAEVQRVVGELCLRYPEVMVEGIRFARSGWRIVDDGPGWISIDIDDLTDLDSVQGVVGSAFGVLRAEPGEPGAVARPGPRLELGPDQRDSILPLLRAQVAEFELSGGAALAIEMVASAVQAAQAPSFTSEVKVDDDGWRRLTVTVTDAPGDNSLRVEIAKAANSGIRIHAVVNSQAGNSAWQRVAADCAKRLAAEVGARLESPGLRAVDLLLNRSVDKASQVVLANTMSGLPPMVVQVKTGSVANPADHRLDPQTFRRLQELGAQFSEKPLRRADSPSQPLYGHEVTVDCDEGLPSLRAVTGPEAQAPSDLAAMVEYPREEMPFEEVTEDKSPAEGFEPPVVEPLHAGSDQPDWQEPDRSAINRVPNQPPFTGGGGPARAASSDPGGFVRSLGADGIEGPDGGAAQIDLDPAAEDLDSPGIAGLAGNVRPPRTGRTHDWAVSARIVGELARLGRPVILAGGLTADNVDEAIAAVHPFG
ncbi:amidohydrolase family protein, partial [Nocardia carnea]|uniref:amidohydrolase family protein n=1 Tax=Nocardia carnea TaxID=37328 RepID=UPI00245536D2